jgi:hypothetical protein
MRSQFFYGLLLALGIYISMLRKQHRGGKPLSTTCGTRVMRIFGVWTFFSLIFIWDVISKAPFSLRMEFFLGLFGVHDISLFIWK